MTFTPPLQQIFIEILIFSYSAWIREWRPFDAPTTSPRLTILRNAHPWTRQHVLTNAVLAVFFSQPS